MKKKRQNWLIPGVAVFVAILALAVSVYEGYETRKFYRLSVRPSISLGFMYSDDGAGWRFSNDGPGPAMVKNFIVLVDGTKVESAREFWEKLGLSKKADVSFLVPGLNKYYEKGDAGWMFWVKSPKRDVMLLKERAYSVKMQICYCSVYDECWFGTFPPSITGPEKTEECPSPGAILSAPP